MKENDIKTAVFDKPTDSFMGLTLSEINQYLPAVRKSEDIFSDIDKLDDGLFLTDALEGLLRLPDKSVDLIIAEPPSEPVHNKIVSGETMTLNEYYQWNENWLTESRRVLKSTGAIYLFCDWKKSGMYHSLLNQSFYVQSRITWQNQVSHDKTYAKGWKNVLSDIWFATKSEEFLFNGQVINAEADNDNSREETINFWSDIFEKGKADEINDETPSEVLTRIFDVSSFKLSWVVDPFTRYGLAGVVAKNMGRRFIGFEVDQDRLLIAMKRIDKT